MNFVLQAHAAAKMPLLTELMAAHYKETWKKYQERLESFNNDYPEARRYLKTAMYASLYGGPPFTPPAVRHIHLGDRW